jgi:hypothetical protein
MAMRRYCPGCFEKQLKIDQLLEDNRLLKEKLRYQERKATKGFFASSTPSAKIPVKPDRNAQRKPKGAKRSHKGAGRKGFEASEDDPVVVMAPEDGGRCPDCGRPLQEKGTENRFVLEGAPV